MNAATTMRISPDDDDQPTRRSPSDDDLSATVSFVPGALLPEMLRAEPAAPATSIEDSPPTQAHAARPQSGIVTAPHLRRRPSVGDVTIAPPVWPLDTARVAEATFLGRMRVERDAMTAELVEIERRLAAHLRGSGHEGCVADVLDWFSLVVALRGELASMCAALHDPRLAPLAGPRTNLGTYLCGVLLAARELTFALTRATASPSAVLDAAPICARARDVAPYCFPELAPFVLRELDALSPLMPHDGQNVALLRESVERSSWHATALRSASDRPR